MSTWLIHSEKKREWDEHKFVGVPSKDEMNEWASKVKEVKHMDMRNCYIAVSKDLSLSHHGILGMKWGVRRYQNSDGSLTSAGKKRYSAEGKQKTEKQKAKEENKRIRQERKQKLANRRRMSDEDLLKEIGRLEKEKKYKELLKEDLERGNKDVNDVLRSAGKKTATMALTGTALYAGKVLLEKNGFDAKVAADYIFQKPNFKK